MLPKWYPNKLFPNEGNYVAVHIKAISRCIPTVVLYVHSEKNESLKGSYFEVSHEYTLTIYRGYFKRFDGTLSALNKLINFYRYFKTQGLLFRHIVQEHGMPILSHVHVMLRATLFALFLKIKEGVPFVISEHWSVFLVERQDGISGIKKLLLKFIAMRARSMTCVSEALKNGLHKLTGRDDISVIYNGIDTDLFKPEASLGKAEDKTMILHVSRLDSHPKNLPGILQSIHRLRQFRQNFELHIVGEGKESESQKALAESLGLLNEVVFFHGYLDQNEVASWMRKSHFLLVFSNYESQSKVILESFSSGIPVIATDVGGIPELVSPDRGILIPPKDEMALIQAIDKMMTGWVNSFDPMELRNYAISVSSLDIVGQKFLDVYQA